MGTTKDLGANPVLQELSELALYAKIEPVVAHCPGGRKQIWQALWLGFCLMPCVWLTVGKRLEKYASGAKEST